MLMVRPSVLVLSLIAAACASVSAQADERRQLGAHVHGHGRLNIAIEGNTLSMELEAPGADIAGFEHEAETAEQKAAIEKAKERLGDGAALFAPAAEAGCAFKSAKVSTGAEHEEEHEHGAKKEGEDEHHHSEFHAEYVFECASPERLTSFAFGYFKEFPNTQALEVSLISPKGQASYEVTRDSPALNLTGAL
jgi:hypothetical protein